MQPNAFDNIAENNSIAAEVFWKPLLADPKINALPFNLLTGKIGRELYFDSEFTDTATIKTTCGFDYKNGTDIVKKELNPAEFDFSVRQCYTEFVKSIWGDKLPDGHKKGELTPEIIARIVEKQSNKFNNDLLWALFLSDTGSSEPFLAGIDGIYTKLAAGAAGGDGTVDAGAISDSDLLPANIEATLNDIYVAQSDLLMGVEDSKKLLIVTQTVYNAWKRFIQVGTSNGGGGFIDRASVVNGVTEINYNGIKMVNASYVDRGLKIYGLAGSPAAVVNPHRVILTLPTNHTVMIDGGGFEMIDPFYDRKDDNVYSPATAMLDYQYGYGEFNVIAGF